MKALHVLIVFLLVIITGYSQGTWEAINIPCSIPTSMIATENNRIFAGGCSYLKYTDDGGETWNVCNDMYEGSGVEINKFLTSSNGDYYIARWNLWKSSNGGLNWTEVNPGLQMTIKDMEFSSTEDLYFIATDVNGSFLFKSEDYGVTWDTISDSLDSPNKILLDDDDNIFIGTKWHGIYRSLDKGATWEHIETGAIQNILIVDMIFAKNGDIIVQTQSKGLLRSSDKGATWNASDSGMEKDILENLIIENLISNESGVLICCPNFIEHYVYYSVDDGINWLPLPNEDLSTDIIRMAIDTNNNIFAATNAAGMFKYKLDATYHSDNMTNVKKKIENPLISCYPNPVESRLTIDFLTKQSNLVINLFDLNGNKLKTIFKGNVVSERQIIELDLTEYPRGSYLLQVASKENTIHKKIILL